MHTCFKTNIAYYFSLVVILILGFYLSLQTAYDKQLQFLTFVLTACCYVVWGIVHHIVHHDLTAKIVIEYVLIGSLGMAVVLFLFTL